MRIIADENLSRTAVEGLRRAGLDVVWIRTTAPGSTDETILSNLSCGDVLLTFDKDFGRLAMRGPLPPDIGIVLFRLSASSPTAMAERVVAAVGSRPSGVGCFAVVEDDRIRLRDLR